MTTRAEIELRRLDGVSARERGNVSEELVLEACLSARSRIPGVLGARLKTDEEDRRGIDVVVETVDGPVLLQVKSSHREAAFFKASRRNLVNAPLLFVIVASFDRVRMEHRVDSAIMAWRRQLALRPKPAPKAPRISTVQAAKETAERAAAAARKADRAAQQAALAKAQADAKAELKAKAAALEEARQAEALREAGARIAEEQARAARRTQQETNPARNEALGLPTTGQRRALRAASAVAEVPRCHADACPNLLDGYESTWRRTDDGAGICRVCDAAMELLFIDLGWCALADGVEAAA